MAWSRSMPPVEFDYEPLDWDTTVHTVEDHGGSSGRRAAVVRPYHWVNLFSEGIAGVLSEHEGAWWYTANLGDPDDNGTIRLPGAGVASRPSFSGLTSVSDQLELTDQGSEWSSSRCHSSPATSRSGPTSTAGSTATSTGLAAVPAVPRCDPNIDWNDPQPALRRSDGDGHADVLIAEDDVFTWHPSLAEAGFARPAHVAGDDEERGPALSSPTAANHLPRRHVRRRPDRHRAHP